MLCNRDEFVRARQHGTTILVAAGQSIPSREVLSREVCGAFHGAQVAEVSVHTRERPGSALDRMLDRLDGCESAGFRTQVSVGEVGSHSNDEFGNRLRKRRSGQSGAIRPVAGKN